MSCRKRGTQQPHTMSPKVLLICFLIAVSALACSSPDWAGGRANVGGVVETGMTEAKSVSLGDAVQVGSKVSGIAAGLEHVSTAGFGRHASIVLYADGNFSRRVTYRYANRSIVVFTV